MRTTKFVVSITDNPQPSPGVVVSALADGLRFDRYHDEPERVVVRLTAWHHARAALRLRWQSRHRFRLSGAGVAVRERESDAHAALERR
jgi:hypothetical protein